MNYFLSNHCYYLNKNFVKCIRDLISPTNTAEKGQVTTLLSDSKDHTIHLKGEKKEWHRYQLIFKQRKTSSPSTVVRTTPIGKEITRRT